MSRTRIVKGTYTKITGGDHNMYAKGNIVTTAGKSINEIGKENGVTCNEPKKPPLAPKHFFVKGWWSSDLAGSKPIEEALIDDIVYFHAETKNIPDGDMVQMRLYDDDNNEIEEPKGKNEKSEYIETISSNKAGITDKKVNGNKIVITLRLANLEKFIANETDRELELYYRCSYKGENIELPRAPSDYLLVKGMPKIIIVNGQWNIAAKAPFGDNFGPTEPKKPYWSNDFAVFAKTYFDKYFNIDQKQTINKKEFTPNELEQKKYILYYDGSSNYAGDMSGQDRFKAGEKFAKDNFDEITKGLGGQEVFLVSHSEGGAYAAGMADYLHNHGIKIGEHVLLSPDEGDEFSINPAIPSYQLLYMFFGSIYNPLGMATKAVKFRRWGDYYAVVDWVVNEHRIKGVKKMGIVHYQSTGWQGVHGSTNSKLVFDRVSDLKEVQTFDAIGEYDKKVYSGKQQTKTTNGYKFYRIDNEYIIFNCPPIIKI
ncbi:hypothetical protein BWK59_14685 [Flavobacterium davisii]|uniref:Uncharacterized protein n=1 Tax=Flavobacterium davisii TaxID=2906077 RepID=A0A246GEY0_9FLAO|nr:hypothetical protein [Flavobacterium davisii]OWP82659.1 hypothetical protein BWK59_14685 [Flavobacterium davisii]